MRTDKIKKIIILLCIILVVVIVMILFLILNYYNNNLKDNYNNDQETANYINENGVGVVSDEDKEKISNTIKKYDFIIVKNCMQEFLNTININNSAYFSVQEGKQVRLFSEQEIGNQAYELLSNTYIKNNNITMKNIFNYVEKLKENVIFIPLDIKEVENEKLKTFIVYGITENDNYKILKEIYAIVNIDEQNNTYSIEPLNNNYQSIEDVEITSLEDSITKQTLNIYRDATATSQDMIRLYLEIYKRLALGFPELSYEYLDDEYKSKRFGSLEEYKSYISENKDYINGLNAIQYKSTESDTSVEYIIMDNKENYIIINEKEPLKFKVMLDAYTINVSEVSEKYNNASKSEKVGMNVDKFIQMINRKDYRTSYNILADSFKNNKFKTEQEFKQYIKNNFFESNEIKVTELEDKGTYFTCKANLIDKKGSESKQISFIMQLKEDDNFVMSFSIE